MRALNRTLAAAIAVVLVVCSGVAFADGDDDDEEDSESKPAVVVLGVTELGETGARLTGEVDPRSRTSTYRFEYGTTTAYGQETSSGSLAASASWRPVSARVDELQPGTTYHYRLVAGNSRGTAVSGDRTFTTATVRPDPAPGADVPAPKGETAPAPADAADTVQPELGTSVALEPGSGTVRVRRPEASSFAPLESGAELPVGTEVDARGGSVALTAALPTGETQTGRFGGGRFVIGQGERGRVDLYLRGPSCPRRSAPQPAADGSAVAQTARKRRSGRRLWGRDKGGRFRTHGKNSHATVRGTRWVVADRCDGTLTRVTEGSVVVRDKVRRKRVVVRVGEQYLARRR